jgi:CRISPR/Cas system CSM-associated protein Csm2 small subunit
LRIFVIIEQLQGIYNHIVIYCSPNLHPIYNMASIQEEDDDTIHNNIIAEILKTCTHGCTEQKIIEQTHLSHDQLRRIMAEIIDEEYYTTSKHVASILQ